MKPENEGTYISHEKVADGKKAIKGISSINDTALITIQGLGMVGVIGVNRRISCGATRISVFGVASGI